MTISLMNAGRGAGKTHALIEWAKRDKRRFVIGTHRGTGDVMMAAGLEGQFLHYTEAKEFLQGREGHTEVALDNFDQVIPSLLSDEWGIGLTTSVILTTNLPTWEHAPKVTEVPVSDWYAEAIKKKYGVGVSFVEGFIKQAVEAVEKTVAETNLDDVVSTLLGVVAPPAAPAGPEEDPEAAWTKGLWRKSTEAPDEPDTKQVRLDELRLGDVLVGRGKVVSLKFIDTEQRIVVESEDAGFKGTLIKVRSALAEIVNR